MILLEGLRPRIKQRWEKLLRAEPAVTALANPDTLIFLMDETLDQLCAAGRTRSVKSWLRDNPALVAPQQSKCACGINPLLAYYSTGILALNHTVQPKLDSAFEEIMLFYHGIAQQDIEALCGVCCNKGASSCSQREIALEAARQANFLRR